MLRAYENNALQMKQMLADENWMPETWVSKYMWLCHISIGKSQKVLMKDTNKLLFIQLLNVYASRKTLFFEDGRDIIVLSALESGIDVHP